MIFEYTSSAYKRIKLKKAIVAKGWHRAFVLLPTAMDYDENGETLPVGKKITACLTFIERKLIHKSRHRGAGGLFIDEVNNWLYRPINKVKRWPLYK